MSGMSVSSDGVRQRRDPADVRPRSRDMGRQDRRLAADHTVNRASSRLGRGKIGALEQWLAAGARLAALSQGLFSATQKYPLVVLVHGGPAGDSATKWAKPFYNMEVLSGLGYFVFYPNARGSLGFGESFTRANVKDIGFGDFRDITSGVESLLNTLPVDRNRIGITGWSYGGYMAMWAGTQTHFFHASVAGPGVSDWQSYYGQVDIEKWLLPYFGSSVYDDPQIYARSSPINFIKQAKTPTMMFAGEVDNVCPTPQSLELWRGLEHMQVPYQSCDLSARNPRVGHSQDQRAVTKAAAAWFEKYLVPLP